MPARPLRRAALATIVLAASAAVLAPRRAPANVEQQRARLPPPADRCADPVAGVWRAHAYYPRQRQWYVFVLHIERAAGASLTGSIDVHAWDGEPTQSAAPACTIGLNDWTVTQPAAGTANGLAIDFHGTAWQLGLVRCGSAPGGYTLDTFVGTIDPARQEFQSVNRYPILDAMVEDVTVFRRTECGGQPGASAPTPAPPPPTAPVPARPRAWSCGCPRRTP